MSLVFTFLLLIIIQAFLDKKLFTSEIAKISHKLPFGLDVDSLRVSGYPVSIEMFVSWAHLISSSFCSTTTRTTLVSLVTFHLPSMIGSYAFVIVGLYLVADLLSAICTQSYADVYVSVSFLRYISSDDLIF